MSNNVIGPFDFRTITQMKDLEKKYDQLNREDKEKRYEIAYKKVKNMRKYLMNEGFGRVA